MKSENVTQKAQEICQQSQLIEKEYINSMLNATDLDVTEKSASQYVVSQESLKNSDIECKVFSVSGLNLALPLSSINGTLKEQDILLGNNVMEADMLIGKINNNDDVIDVIDLNYLIMNGIKDADYLNRYDGTPVDILLLQGSSVGIIYEEEGDAQTIPQEQVCWRNAASDRIWLAGTVKQKGFALLDPQGIFSLLNNKR